MQKVFNKAWRVGQDCGVENIFLNNSPEQSNKNWDLEGSISSVSNEQCHYGPLSNEKNSRYNFDINVSFETVENETII